MTRLRIFFAAAALTVGVLLGCAPPATDHDQVVAAAVPVQASGNGYTWEAYAPGPWVLRPWPGMPGGLAYSFGLAAARAGELTGVATSWGPAIATNVEPVHGEIALRPVVSCGDALAAACTFRRHGAAEPSYFSTSAVIGVTYYGLTRSDLWTVITKHEMGHVWGLGHYNSYYAGVPQIMNSVTNPYVADYQAGDRAGLWATTH